jgi:nucleoside-diphosphate-sugar epimerase
VRILFTGASSFTGYWFADALRAAGHEVVAPLRGGIEGGADPLRGERLARLTRAGVELIPDCAFGTARFMDVATSGFDVLCHHAAEVGDYRNPDFDIAGAVAANTANLRQVLAAVGKRAGSGVVLSGSFFEANEGAGSAPRRAFSPYAVSKALTADVVRYRCQEAGIPFAKFVIPHPFGPLEQPRLGAYLAKTWRSGGTAEIKTPAYIRDNIHVGLLAAAYARFVGAPSTPERQLNPSGYIESQGSFVERIGREVRQRTNLACEVKLLRQQEFSEPLIRVNTDSAVQYVEAWDEGAAWDAYAASIAG